MFSACGFAARPGSLGVTVPTLEQDVRLQDEPWSEALDPVSDPELGGSEVLLPQSHQKVFLAQFQLFQLFQFQRLLVSYPA